MTAEAMQAPVSRFADRDENHFIEARVWDGLTDDEREQEIELLTARGLKPFRVWNQLRNRVGIVLMPLAKADEPVMIGEIPVPQEFYIDDARIAGAECVTFLVQVLARESDAKEVLAKFLESLAQQPVKIA